MKKSLAFAALVLLATGCVTEPARKPLVPEAIAQLPHPTAYTRIDPRGIGVEYLAQDSSAVGSQFGLLGALVVAGIDAAANSSPLKVAETGADQMTAAFQIDKMRGEFRAHLDERLKNAPPFNKPMQVVVMDPEQKIEVNAFPDPAVVTIVFGSTLSQDLRYLHVTADVNIFNKANVAPAPAKKKSSSANKNLGLVYRNHFAYYSDRLAPAPDKTQAEIDAAIEAIKAKYPGKRLTDSQKVKMRKEIEDARKPAPAATKAEYLVQQWLANDSTLLNEKLRQGASEIAKMVARDLGDSAAFNTKAKLPPKTVLEEANGRVLVRYNTLPMQGALGSEPATFAATPSNGVIYSKKSNTGTATTDKK